jgi:hypothetical protein
VAETVAEIEREQQRLIQAYLAAYRESEARAARVLRRLQRARHRIDRYAQEIAWHRLRKAA